MADLTLAAHWRARLGAQRTGDLALADEVAGLAGQARRRGIAVAVLEGAVARMAGVGDAGGGRPVRPDTPFQPGSVTKTFTAALFATLVADNVVNPDDRLADLLPERPWREPVGDITLAELASHRSGLPRLRLSLAGWARSLLAEVTGADPYGETTVDIVSEANAAADQAGPRGEYDYSNLGYALLGHVLAAKAGMRYPELLRTRLLQPLGLASTMVRTPVEGPPTGAARGHDVRGRAREHWDNPAWTPTGSSVWSTVEDLASYADATMRGSAPGADAARPRWPAGDLGEIGYAWMALPARAAGSAIIWHNGGAGGHTSFVGFERARDRVVAVLSNTEESVDNVGMALLGNPPARGARS